MNGVSMRWVFRIGFVVAIIAAFLPVSAAGADSIPRVLVLGDSIYAQPARLAAGVLAGKAEVFCPDMKTGQVFNTTTALAHLDELLGDEKWDLIHFNYGLGDLVYRAPGMKSFRVMPKQAGGVRATTPAEYERNLTLIVTRLEATGAKLVWAHTTPIQSDSRGLYDIGSELEYNAIAARIMAARGIPVNDMHTAVADLLEGSKQASGPPTSFGKLSIHPPIVAAICRELSLPVPSASSRRSTSRSCSN
jgi:hypothetical protein